jgi:hypothetical protein
MSTATVATILVIGAVPVLCFALGFLCGIWHSNKLATKVPDQEVMRLRKGW